MKASLGVVLKWPALGYAAHSQIPVITRNLGNETPCVVTRGNLKTDRDAEEYRDLYGHWRKMANMVVILWG